MLCNAARSTPPLTGRQFIDQAAELGDQEAQALTLREHLVHRFARPLGRHWE